MGSGILVQVANSRMSYVERAVECDQIAISRSGDDAIELADRSG